MSDAFFIKYFILNTNLHCSKIIFFSKFNYKIVQWYKINSCHILCRTCRFSAKKTWCECESCSTGKRDYIQYIYFAAQKAVHKWANYTNFTANLITRKKWSPPFLSPPFFALPFPRLSAFFFNFLPLVFCLPVSYKFCLFFLSYFFVFYFTRLASFFSS